MSNLRVAKAVVVPATNLPTNQAVIQLALYNPDGDSASVIVPQEDQEDSTADAVGDLADDFNALLAKLRAAGILIAE